MHIACFRDAGLQIEGVVLIVSAPKRRISNKPVKSCKKINVLNNMYESEKSIKLHPDGTSETYEKESKYNSGMFECLLICLAITGAITYGSLFGKIIDGSKCNQQYQGVPSTKNVL